MERTWDIFCRVVDNFGDIGVCWRLGRQLAAEHGLAVRLWVDDLAALAPLAPEVDAAADGQVVAGVEIRRWRADFPAVEVAGVVIEAFACELPPAYLAAMARRSPAPRWVNLEYLSAEDWVEDCHGMASPHPTLPLVKHFFFPGFTPRTGGLLREAEVRRANEFAPTPIPGNPVGANSFALPGQGGDGRMNSPLQVSLFCYDTAPVGELLDAWAAGPLPVCCHVPPGKPLQAVARHLGGAGPWRVGNLEALPIPFLPQPDYDRLLWRCQVNFVRGEDSFVRAQWAGQPFVWHIYPQDDAAHMAKLEAFLGRYTAGMGDDLAAAARGMFLAWNHGRGVAAAWTQFAAHLEELEAHGQRWARTLAESPDLAAALVNFCEPRV